MVKYKHMGKLQTNNNGQWHLHQENQRGVHTSGNPNEPGRSAMGILNQLGAPKEAKLQAKRVSREQKSMPKPKIAKMEEAAKNVNGSYEPPTNLAQSEETKKNMGSIQQDNFSAGGSMDGGAVAMSEELEMSDRGQWNIKPKKK